MHLRRQRISVLRRGTESLQAVDIDVGFSQNSRGFQRGYRVAADGVTVFRAELHHHFDWSLLPVFIWNNKDVGYIANIDPAEPHWSAFAQSLRVIEIRVHD